MPPPIGFAHRGTRLEHPDNSLAGFARALELGAGALETDAWVTADGVVVLDHDGVVGRGPRRRPIRAHRHAALGGRFPSLDDLYERCGTGYELSVDVKDGAAARGLIAGARRAGAADRLWVCSPDLVPLAAWRELDPEAHLVHSTGLAQVTGVRHPYRQLSPAELSARVATHADTLRSVGIGAVNLHHRSWSPAAVAPVQAHGLRAFAWDCQRRTDLERAIELGVDAVYSDDVALMVAVLAETGGPPEGPASEEAER